MKLSKAVVPAASVGAFGVVAVTAAVLMIQNGQHASGGNVVFRPESANSTAATHSTSHPVAKPAAVVPRSTVVVKKPTVQGATVTDPTAAPTPSDSPTDAASTDPAAIPSTSDGWGPPNQQTNPAIPPPVRSRSAGPPCIGSECPTPTG